VVAEDEFGYSLPLFGNVDFYLKKRLVDRKVHTLENGITFKAKLLDLTCPKISLQEF
jgi:hypothetical protein